MPGTDPDDVLAAARSGEAWAVARLYEDLKGPVVTFVRLRGARDPDDVTSETFLQVFRDLARFEGDAAAFRAWVFTIAKRRLIDEHRRFSRRVREVRMTAGVDAAGGDAADEAMAELGNDRVHELLAGLTVDQREAVLLRIVADLSLHDTAQVMGRSVGAVKVLQHRALAALRAALLVLGVTP
ncbi:MAG: RNA polymerase sigma factor [Actinobacteria bacterium]|nr:RNA polymerase sigma factor [Actinomycetota bacterium]